MASGKQNGASFDANALTNIARGIRDRCDTLQLMVLDATREAIHQGLLAPGMRLRQEELAAAFDTNRILVREALRVLEYEGLVESEPRTGFAVRTLDADQMEEIYELRSVLESYAIRLAVPLLTKTDVAELSELYEETQRAEVPDERLAKGEAFAMRLYSVTARPALLGLIARLRQSINRPLRQKLAQHSPEYRGSLFDAVKAGDAEAAAGQLEAHYRRLIALLRRFIREERRIRA